MLNEPFLEILVDVFMKHCKFVLWKIIDGFEWRLCSFLKINGIVIQSMLGQGVCIFPLKHILEFLVLGKKFMWTWFNIWWGKNLNKKCISCFGSLHEGFCSNKQGLGAPRPFCTTRVFFLLQILHASNKGFTFQSLVLWCFKVKTPCMPMHSWIM